MEVNFRPRTRVRISRSLILLFSVSRHDAFYCNKYNALQVIDIRLQYINHRGTEFSISDRLHIENVKPTQTELYRHEKTPRQQ
jgi:hypothetical protein